MRLASYDLPRVAGFAARPFKAETRRRRKAIAGALGLALDGRRWVCLGRAKGRRRARWRPKLYLCLSARDYWPAVSRLIDRFQDAPFQWKFYAGRDGYERPDKIVFYAFSAGELRSIARRVRPLLEGCRFHALRHAAATGRAGLEPRGRAGLYVGTDPSFLKWTSWRLYRAVCASWAELNRDHLEGRPGGRAGWLARMNLSAVHEGPARLSPPSRGAAFIRRQWRIINEPA